VIASDEAREEKEWPIIFALSAAASVLPELAGFSSPAVDRSRRLSALIFWPRSRLCGFVDSIDRGIDSLNKRQRAGEGGIYRESRGESGNY